MNYLFKSLVGIALLASATLGYGCNCGCSSNNVTLCSPNCGNSCERPRSIFIERSQNDDLPRTELIYKNYKYNEEDCFNGKLMIGYDFNRSYRDDRIAQSLFGCTCLTFSGSQYADRKSTDILADNFGLSPQANASICFSPQITNNIIDFNLYLGLGELCEGLYFQIYGPLVHSKWELCDSCDSCCGCSNSSNTNTLGGDGCCTKGTLPNTAFPAGYMSNVEAGTQTPLTSFTTALNGNTFGDMKSPWGYGKFFPGCDCTHDTEFADLHMNLGYNFYQCPDYHIGIYAVLIAPTGTRIDGDHARYIFRPTIGYDHWQLGGGLTAHAELYNCDDEHTINAYFNGYLTHMFKREQVRSFDFKSNGLLSRYLLLKEFDADNNYTGNLYNAIDYTTRRAEVSVGVKGEFDIEFVYKNDCGFGAGLGYDLYGRSHEDIDCICGPCNSALAAKNLGIKGCAPIEVQASIYNGTTWSLTTGPANYLLSSTESDAKITGCGDVDNPQLLQSDATPVPNSTMYNNPIRGTATAPVVVAESSSTTITVDQGQLATVHDDKRAPVLITANDLDLCSAALPGYLINKIFGHLDYEWESCDWEPFIRIGGEVDIASSSDLAALNSWSIFVNGSVSF